ncbi:MAG: cysteine--tRNA ligase [Alphaproteobacteria bacterium]|nr:cysteine--tRNA ligase [Alphaproteobacteria bacterium]
MSLKLYNSLSRVRETFQPIDQDHVRMYVCGPTVYDRAHIGNARPVVVFDVLYRLLKLMFPKVTYVRNITDVDDKINAASKNLGISIDELTVKTTAQYHKDMNELGVLSPDHEPRATKHIPEMILLIESLIEKGYAYESQGHVLFKVSEFKSYGHLSRRNPDELLAGARVEIAPYKQDAGDFVLWKPSTEDLPGWDSPWGRGRPGWHIECSAMSWKYLGEVFDIHGGGIDLIFPHHENEAAQSLCAHGTKKMANFWLHNGHLTVDGSKMSKSLGNFLTVDDLLANHRGETIRLALLMTHYRQPLDWTDDVLFQAKHTLDRLYSALRGYEGVEPSQAPREILEALEDDLNTPLALSHIHQIVSGIHKSADENEKKRLIGELKGAVRVLGLLQSSPEEWLQGEKTKISAAEIESFIEQRNLARKNKDFAEADRVRKHLLDLGVQLEDTAQGTIWRGS